MCELSQGAATCSNPAIPGPRVSKGNSTLLLTRTAQVGNASDGTGPLWCVKKRENKASRAVLFLDSKDVALQGSHNHHKLPPDLDWDNMALGP